jgi:hypothetical protein
MRIASTKSATVADLNVPLKSMYLLTAPSTPEPARRHRRRWRVLFV